MAIRMAMRKNGNKKRMVSTYTKVLVKFSALRATIWRRQGEQLPQFLLHGYLTRKEW
jgi:hypothetical protein